MYAFVCVLPLYKYNIFLDKRNRINIIHKIL